MATSGAGSWVPKSSLIRGAVKPWHVLFLLGVSWAVSGVGAHKIAEHVAIENRMAIRDMAISALGALIILAFTVIVPEFRRSLAVLFSRPSTRPTAADLSLACAVTLCWGYGLYRVGTFLFLLVFPQAYQALGFVESVGPVQLQFLVFWAGAVLVAPFAEELIFRGYLLNLWAARWGLWPAVIVSSLVFGLLHWTQAVFAAPIGFVLALVYLRYDSLWPGIFLHAVYNFLATPWILGGYFYVKHQASIGHVSHWMAEIVVALLLVPIFLVFWRRFKPVTS